MHEWTEQWYDYVFASLVQKVLVVEMESSGEMEKRRDE
jgi:hypothetical protein